MKKKPPLLDKPYPKHRPVTPEEAELWKAEAVEPKKARQRAHPKPRPIKPAAPPHAPLPSCAPDSFPAAHLEPSLRVKIRRGAVAIEATLDLHGHTRLSAEGVLLRFIAEGRGRGLRTVLVITGKGRHAEERGMLSLWLERMLAEPPLRDSITGFETAAPRHGGAGAWYIRLKKLS